VPQFARDVGSDHAKCKVAALPGILAIEARTRKTPALRGLHFRFSALASFKLYDRRLNESYESNLMNTPRINDKGVRRVARVQVVEWLVDAPFAVEVHEVRRPNDQSTLEMIRYVKLAFGIFSHSPPGSLAGFRRNRRTCRMDG
jgi:hypothetical protein